MLFVGFVVSFLFLSLLLPHQGCLRWALRHGSLIKQNLDCHDRYDERSSGSKKTIHVGRTTSCSESEPHVANTLGFVCCAVFEFSCRRRKTIDEWMDRWMAGWLDGCIGLSVLVAYWTLGVVGCLVSTVAQV